MSDDLIKRLLDWSEHDEGKINDVRQEAADRIEQLERERKDLGEWRDNLVEDLAETEAKLAKAVEALLGIVDYYDKANPFRTADYHWEYCKCDRCKFDRARAALAKLEVDGEHN